MTEAVAICDILMERLDVVRVGILALLICSILGDLALLIACDFFPTLDAPPQRELHRRVPGTVSEIDSSKNPASQPND